MAITAPATRKPKLTSISTGADSGYQMLACVRGPDTGPAIRDVLAMVNSLRPGQPPGR
jgi:hypothetical protein